MLAKDSRKFFGAHIQLRYIVIGEYRMSYFIDDRWCDDQRQLVMDVNKRKLEEFIVT